MKFLLFATTALAATVTKRQLSVVEAAVASVSSGTQSLRDGINAFNGINDAVALQSAASGLVSTINSANSQVAGSADLGNDAANLAPSIQALANLVTATVNDLKSKKQAFVSAGVGGVVYDNAVQLRDAAATFQATVISKVPDSLKPIGQQLSAPITAALEDAVSSFADQQGSTGGGSSSSAPSSTTGGATYPTGGASTTSAPVYTTSAPATTSAPVASYTTSAPPVATYTGAAIVNAANGYGAVAMAVLAGAAML